MSQKCFERRALFWKKEKEKVRCMLCERRCVIEDGERGVCKTRENRDGILFTLVYGNISSVSLNPIEKKPLYHFYPGTFALTVGSWSCNFYCPWCQNYRISKVKPGNGEFIAPVDFIKLCEQSGADGTSMSFNEPTLFAEWAIDVFELATQKGLYNTYVTNGYMTEDVLVSLWKAGLDGMNVDLKGNEEVYKKYCKGNFKKVFRNVEKALSLGIHVEITTLVVKGVNDDIKILDDMARKIAKHLGEKIPWHITRAFPSYLYHESPVSVEFLNFCAEKAMERGLWFVYVGNVPAHPLLNTRCPSCGKVVIKRDTFMVIEKHTIKGRCEFCGQDLGIRE